MLSQEVRALIGDGNQAYIDGDVAEAIRVMQEVIRIEPRAPQPWKVLAQCYDDMGESKKGLQLRIMAAHLNQDPEEWERLAEQSKYDIALSVLPSVAHDVTDERGTISKLSTATGSYTRLTQRTSMRYGTGHSSQSNLASSELYVYSTLRW